jgi:AcrR family transcriptional regulator
VSRQRILDAALALMGEHGVAGTSMRMLAGECGLNVATLYHHFPSKESLLQAVLAEQGYLHRLAEERPPAALASGNAGATRRLERLVRWLWDAVVPEEPVWRLLLGESMRGEPTAQRAAANLVEALDDALTRWLRDLVPELGPRTPATAALVRTLLFSLMVEHLALGPDPARADRAAKHLSRFCI